MQRMMHGLSKTSTYRSYHSMLQRCLNSRNREFKDYGGRGIKVCDRWLGPDGFRSFLSDMGERPASTSIDRIDVNGNYTPSNCRWADRIAQARNRRKLDGKSSKHIGVSWNKFARKWHANIKVNRKQIHIGYFTTESEALEARKSAEKKFW